VEFGFEGGEVIANEDEIFVEVGSFNIHFFEFIAFGVEGIDGGLEGINVGFEIGIFSIEGNDLGGEFANLVFEAGIGGDEDGIFRVEGENFVGE
jgi:hypothetical protein